LANCPNQNVPTISSDEPEIEWLSAVASFFEEDFVPPLALVIDLLEAGFPPEFFPLFSEFGLVACAEAAFLRSGQRHPECQRTVVGERVATVFVDGYLSVEILRYPTGRKHQERD
jgi:hypothetical protein